MVVLGSNLSFLLLICILGILEDVDEMFALECVLTMGRNYMPGVLTVLITFPDLFTIEIVSVNGIFTNKGQLRSRSVRLM
jgi:hypothetical protein